jgi:hypothetical protein
MASMLNIPVIQFSLSHLVSRKYIRIELYFLTLKSEEKWTKKERKKERKWLLPYSLKHLNKTYKR